MEPLTFVDEPPSYDGTRTGPPRKWETAADLMRNNPTRWLVLEHCRNLNSSHSLAWRIRTRRVKTFSEGQWEAVSRGQVVYARYMGD